MKSTSLLPVSHPASAVDRRRFITLGAAFSTVFAAATGHAGAVAEERGDLRQLFEVQGVAGAFALYEPFSDRTVTVDGERAARRYVPASTFKIANSLIALEAGVVKD